MQGAEVSIPLRSRGARLALVLLVAVPGALIGFQAARRAEAARLGGRFDVADLRRAVILDPGNAGHYHQLGLVYAYASGPARLPDAVRSLR